MQPKCSKCGMNLELFPSMTSGEFLVVCPRGDYKETTIDDLILKTDGQAVQIVTAVIIEYLVSQSIRSAMESDRLTKIEERIAYLERQGDEEEGDMKI